MFKNGESALSCGTEKTFPGVANTFPGEAVRADSMALAISEAWLEADEIVSVANSGPSRETMMFGTSFVSTVMPLSKFSQSLGFGSFAEKSDDSLLVLNKDASKDAICQSSV